MGLINRRTRLKVGGVRVVIRPISIKLLGFFIRYGCVVILRARRGKRKGTTFIIDNHYFGNVNEGTPLPEEIGVIRRNNTRSSGKRRTRLSEYLIYVGHGSQGLPVKGVVSAIRISKGSDERVVFVKAGKTQNGFEPPEPPRI